jgi:glycosyltransferase involved in cell wall biosynthesis
MKIGIDARLWSESGVGRYIRNLINGIDERELKTPNHSYVVFLLQKDFDTVNFKSPSIEKKILNVRWHSIKEQLIVKNTIQKEKLDLIHFPYFSIPLSYNDPFVITIHDLIIKNFPTGKASTLPSPIYKLKHAMYGKILNHGINNSKMIITPSEFVKKDILHDFDVPSEKISVTYEGIDDTFSDESKIVESVKDIPFFLYVGNAYPHKNIEFLIKGFSEFIERYPQYTQTHLILVGKEDYFYKRIKNTINSTSNIIFLHDISDTELSYLYKHAFALLSASKSEGFGLPLLEAMKSKCLVVCSDIPIFKEICGKAAIYFNNTKTESLAHAFYTVLNMSSQDKKRMISLGTAQANNFSWDKMVQKTIKIYESSTGVRSSK